MKKENKHIIQKFQLDLNTDQANAQKQLLDSAHELINQKIIPITERLLNEWADENTHIQLDQLVIDLGNIPLDEFTHSLPDEYEKKIKETLRQLFIQESLKHREEFNRKTRKQALLDQLIYYLEEGEFPWQGTLTSVDDLVLELLKTKKGKLQKLKSALSKNQQVNRLVGSLHVDTLDLLLAELAFPDAATQALLLIGKLARFNHVNKMNIHRKQIEFAVFRKAFLAVGYERIIFSGKTISQIFYELLSVLSLERDELLNYQKQFSRFAQEEEFLSKFLDIPDELKKQSPIKSTTPKQKKNIENEVVNELGVLEEQTRQNEYQKNISNLSNAGLILVYPYLRTLFDRFNWLNEKGFEDDNCRTKALLITDYLVYGEREVVPEHELVLNKILCGMHPKDSLSPLIMLSDSEKHEADNLIESAIQHWTILKDTSKEGYRVSFLQRDGILMFRDESWFMRVERKGFDMLLEHLPYTISIIRLPWMKHKLFVEW